MNKYENIKVEYDGIKFDSKKEAERYKQLKALQETGEISHLRCQPRFDFKIDNKLMFYYKADFDYCTDDGQYIVEDVKSSYTAKLPLFKLKKKIIEQVYKIKIDIV